MKKEEKRWKNHKKKSKFKIQFKHGQRDNEEASEREKTRHTGTDFGNVLLLCIFESFANVQFENETHQKKLSLLAIDLSHKTHIYR